jgi:NADPH:quinone reductase-like Zn-dependent oxidoreductase
VGKNELRDRVVLVQGTGGVSIFALQFANAAKARVIATSSSDDKLARVRELGARDGINYRTHPKWSEQVMELTSGHGADLVVDVGGKETLEQSVKSLAYGGLLSIVGGLSGYDGSISSLGLLNKTASARGVFVGSRADYQRMRRVHRSAPLAPGHRQGLYARRIRRRLAAPADRQSSRPRGAEAGRLIIAGCAVRATCRRRRVQLPAPGHRARRLCSRRTCRTSSSAR